MNDAKRMHALMIGQPNVGAEPKAKRRKAGRSVKAVAGTALSHPAQDHPAPAAEAAPSSQTDRALWRRHRQRAPAGGAS